MIESLSECVDNFCIVSNAISWKTQSYPENPSLLHDVLV